MRAGDARGALAVAERVLAVDGSRELAHRLRVRSLLRLGRTNAAAGAAEQGIAACPLSAGLHADAAVALLASDRLDDADAAARTGAVLGPTERDPLRAQALVALARCDLGAAEAHCRRLITADAQDLEATTNLALALAGQGRRAEAAGFLRSAVRLSETTDRHRLLLTNSNRVGVSGGGVGAGLLSALLGGRKGVVAVVVVVAIVVVVVRAPVFVALAVLLLALLFVAPRLSRRLRGPQTLTALPAEAGVRVRVPRGRAATVER